MWQLMAQRALDIARERAEDARREALADESRRMRALERRLHEAPAGPSRPRAGAARVLRGVSDVFDAVSNAACDAAVRLDGRAAYRLPDRQEERSSNA
jgi:hypothetical protein